MSSNVFYDNGNEFATLTVTFNVAGVATDPSSVSCVVTDPAGGIVTHTYQGTAPADIVKLGTGNYQLDVACSPSVTGIEGLWSYTFIGTGAAADVQPGTWRVLALDQSHWYVGPEELKDRLDMTDDTSQDSVIADVCSATSRWIDEFCGRHFYRITDTRTYEPENIWLITVDDLVSVSSLNIDLDGDGVYETAWTLNSDYMLKIGERRYNKGEYGEPRPYTQVQVLKGGNTWFPFVWPFTHQDRVQITGVFGWPQVPAAVHQAALLIAADWVKLKDAPWGVAGMGELGVVRTSPNPWIADQLRPYIRARGKVGV